MLEANTLRLETAGSVHPFTTRIYWAFGSLSG